MKLYYIAVVNQNTLFGSLSSLERISRGIKHSIEVKEPSQSSEGKELFINAVKKSKVQ